VIIPGILHDGDRDWHRRFVRLAAPHYLGGVALGAVRTAELRNSMVLALAVFLGAAWLAVPRWGNDGLWAAFMLMMSVRAATLALTLPRSLAGGSASLPR
jgi:hypothetical protein